MDKVDDIIKKMSLEDKIAFCSGKDFWHTKKYEKYGIPAIMVADGPHGLRKQVNVSSVLNINESVNATCFPTAVTMGSTWNRDLIAEVATAIGTEAKAEKVSIVLGPGINIKRNPLCGRNFEYFSEDPYLAGELGASYVGAMQGNTRIGTSLKHFACNSQEYKRYSSNSQVDERTLREIYLSSFEKVVKKAQPTTIMCAYNKLNGNYCSDNTWLLTDVLRKEWGFKGMVVTDWGALNDRIESFKAGCDLAMPGGSAYQEQEALCAVKKGILLESDIDTCVKRILELVFTQTAVLQEKVIYDTETHHTLAKKTATEGMVLLQNKDNLLPIKKDARIAVFGHMAEDIRYQGAGSSHIQPTKISSLLENFTNLVFDAGCDNKGHISEEKLAEISEIAKKVDVAIVCVGLTPFYESEGFDRENLDIPPGHNKMVEVVQKANPNTVVVLMGGSVMNIPWKNDVKAILYTGLCGQAGGSAIYDILIGKENPSGKLTETWPLTLSDVPCASFYAKDKKHAEYREGIYVGYRYYDKANKEVQFPFGYGLSYTTFEYSNLTITKLADEYHYRVAFDVKNVGDFDGAEVAQVYIGNPQDGIFRAKKELKGFEKVFLKTGEKKTVSVFLDRRSFSVFCDGWKVPTGMYDIMVGSSSQSIHLQEKITLVGENIASPDYQKGSWYEDLSGVVSIDDFEKLLGHHVTQDILEKGSFTLSNTLYELRQFSKIANMVCKVIEKHFAKQMRIDGDYENPEYRMAIMASLDCSLTGLINSSCGIFSKKLAKALVECANGNILKGFLAFLQ